MMTNENDINKLLEPWEKNKLQELIGKLISQKSLLATLSKSEQQELFFLLNKVNLLIENPNLEIQDNLRQTQNLCIRDLLSNIIIIFSYIVVFFAVVTVPSLIALSITNSQGTAILTAIRLTLFLFLCFGALLGKVSWGMATFVGFIIFIVALPVPFLISLSLNNSQSLIIIIAVLGLALFFVLSILAAFFGKFQWTYILLLGVLIIISVASITLFQFFIQYKLGY